MKRFIAVIAVLLVVGLFMGCGMMELKDDAIGNTTGYFAGKGMGYAVNEGAPNSVSALEAVYDGFMARTIELEMVPPAESIALYTSCITIWGLEVDDTYGLISDLTFMIILFSKTIYIFFYETNVHLLKRQRLQ